MRTYHTVKEAAILLGCSPYRLWRRIRGERIPTTRMRGPDGKRSELHLSSSTLEELREREAAGEFKGYMSR